MAKKISIYNAVDNSNPEVQCDFVFVQGRGAMVARGKMQEVTPVYQEVLQNANENYRKFAKSNMQISGNTPETYNSI
jgi:hypothetical protein